MTQTPAMRSWYMNVPSQVLVDPNGHKWLDMIWVDGTLDDYNVIFRRIDLGGGLAGDVNLDGRVDVSDLLITARSWSRSTGQSGFDPACDLNNDGTVDAADLLILAGNWPRFPGDINSSGRVDVSDVLFLAGSWGLKTGDPGYDARCDLNGDGDVDAVDLLILASNWGM
jgi:hypothetical protein